MTYRELYEAGRRCLRDASVHEEELDARLLLEFLCHTDRSYLLAHGDEPVSGETEEQYLKMVSKRAAHIPLQYITNEQEFMGLPFYVNQNVLIPRQDTECLVEEAMREIQDGMAVLDVCTGSGCIMISLMKYKNDLRCVATDLSKEALQVAERNRQTLGVTDGLRLVQSDLLENAEGIRKALHEITERLLQRDVQAIDRFDVIISNPPYICSDVIETLEPEVKDHEPRMALDGTADGLLFYRKLAEQAPDFLNHGGRLFFEIGYDQGQAVTEILTQSGYTDIRVVKDLAGLDRVVSAVWHG
ncbi:MAG: peptide chain release factor N(5)-glutamine methyltransferase [bacterium]|nr:peptide chain release factor N(5)-glutamine methyltransferase [bacterium]